MTRYSGSLRHMFARPTAELRDELLALNGVGPETADSILLYAGNHPVFVVDAYTRRILERHGIVSSAATYDEIRLLFEYALGGMSYASAEPGRDARCRQDCGRTARLVSHSFTRQPGGAHCPGSSLQRNARAHRRRGQDITA
jgi:hypothetical protein